MNCEHERGGKRLNYNPSEAILGLTARFFITVWREPKRNDAALVRGSSAVMRLPVKRLSNHLFNRRKPSDSH